MLRHTPVLTYDVDLWIEDTEANRRRCEEALAELGAEWGEAEKTWGPAGKLAPGWMDRQAVFCLTSPHGAIDIFRSVRGLEDWGVAAARALHEKTASGVSYLALSDEDMLTCQYALDPSERNEARVAELERILGRDRT